MKVGNAFGLSCRQIGDKIVNNENSTVILFNNFSIISSHLMTHKDGMDLLRDSQIETLFPR